MNIQGIQMNYINNNKTKSNTAFKATYSQIETVLKNTEKLNNVARNLSLDSESIKEFLIDNAKILKEIGDNLLKRFDYKLGESQFIPGDIGTSAQVRFLQEFDNDFNEGPICLGTGNSLNGVNTESQLYKVLLEKLDVEKPDVIELVPSKKSM